MAVKVCIACLKDPVKVNWFAVVTAPVPCGVIVMSPFVTKPVIVDAVVEISVCPILTGPVPCVPSSKAWFEVSFSILSALNV